MRWGPRNGINGIMERKKEVVVCNKERYGDNTEGRRASASQEESTHQEPNHPHLGLRLPAF